VAKPRIIDRDLGWAKTLREIEALARRGFVSIEVGFVDEKNAAKAAYNEFGTRDIPERPFMRTAFDQNLKKYHQMARRHMSNVAMGLQPMRTFEKAIGEEMRDDIVKSIQSWAVPPNATETVREKGRNDPLVDTGAMQRAVVVQVKKGR
jgi:hypothetical protein